MKREAATHIRSFFEEQFTVESIRREIQRAGVLFGIFLGSLAFMLLANWSFGDEALAFHHPGIGRILTGFMVIMACYEFFIWGLLRYRLRQKLIVPEFGKFVNGTAELLALSFVLYLLADSFEMPVTVMQSPLTSGYFLFIILSTLRLNFSLSVYTGLLSGVLYAVLGFYLLARSGPLPVEPNFLTPLMFASKGVVLLMAGISAGYVAREIQKSIRTSIERLENQNQIITLFGQQISREIVDVMLRQKGALESRLMRVSVMFLDIRDFTTFAETRPPEEVVAYQNAFFGIVIETVNRHHGIINQFLGDGCMITFGAPLMLDNPCDNAVRAGLEIMEAVPEATRRGQLPPTRLGIGIHVGDAVTGNIGTDTRQQYSITGNVVILASRIEQLNKDFGSQMLASKEVIECLSEKPEGAQALGYVHVKGRAQDVFLYRLG
jgi:adenylate cyclase